MHDSEQKSRKAALEDQIYSWRDAHVVGGGGGSDYTSYFYTPGTLLMVDIDFLLYNRISFIPFVQGERTTGGGPSALHVSAHPLLLAYLTTLHVVVSPLNSFYRSMSSDSLRSSFL